VAALLLFALLTGATLSLSVTSWRERLRAFSTRPLVQLLGVPLAIVGAIVVYSAKVGLPIAPRAIAYGAYLFVPALIAAPRIGSQPSPVQVLAAALCLWLPVEFHLLPPVALPPSGGLPVAELAALTTGLYLFLVARPVDRIGYTFLLTRRDAALALAATAAFAIPGIPLGIGSQFLTWHPRVNVVSGAVVPFAIYLATAVPEEFLFRGLIQNSLERLFGRAGLPVAALVFGLAHLPDRRYVVLATLAGVAYGWVYRRTRRITASAITHALVDWIWILLFRVR
jgi:CAAX protease family protein